MKAVSRKALADLLARPWQSLLIIVTMAAAACLLYLGLATTAAVTSQYEQLMSQTHGAHIYVRLPGGAGNEGTVTRLRELPGVADTELRSAFITDLAIADSDRIPTVQVTAVPPGQPAKMGYVVVAGRSLVTGDRGAAVLDLSLARYFGIQVGDRVQVSTPAGPRPVTVVGLEVDPAWVEYPLGGVQSLYVLPDTFADLTVGIPPAKLGAFLGLWLANPADAGRVAATAGQVETASPLSWLQLRQASQLIHGWSLTFILAFGILALSAGALITANIVGGSVLSQYKELATLKVLGFTKGQVLLLVVSQNAALGLMGGAVGALLGHLAAARMLLRLSEAMGNLGPTRFSPAAAAAVTAAVAAIASLAAALAARGAVAARPAAALRAGFAAPGRGGRALSHLFWGLPLPVAVRLGLQDALARPARALLTVGSIALTLLTITMSISTGSLVQRLGSDPYTQGINYDIGVELRHLGLAETEAAVRALPQTQGYYTQAYMGARLTAKGAELSLPLKAVDGDWGSFRFPILAGRMVQGPEDLLVTPGVLESLGVQIGDRIRLEVGGRVLDAVVRGTYRDVANLGQDALMTLDGLRQFVPTAQPGYVMIKLKAGSDVAAARRDLLRATEYRIGLIPLDGTMPPFIQDSQGLARWMSLLMVLLAMFSVFNATLLSAREQVREVGIRKAIGLTPGQILAGVASAGAMLGLIGSALAVPLGLLLTRLVVTVLADRTGFGGLPAGLNPGYLPALLVGGAVLAAAAALPAAFWASRVAPARVLRAE